MIDINLNNYEEYIVDYFDENLNSLDEKALMSFLNKNPQLQEEFYAFKNTYLSSESITFNDKEILKKDSCLLNSKESNFNELCIAKIEGDLTSQQEIDFNTMLDADPKKKKDLGLFTLTKTHPDKSIVFKNKKKLKRKHKSVVIYSFISAAAAILLLALIYNLIPKSGNVLNERKISQNSSNAKNLIIKDNNIELEKNPLKVKNHIIQKISIKNINPPIISKIKEKDQKVFVERKDYNQLAFLQAKEIKIKERGIANKNIFNRYYIQYIPTNVKRDESISFKSFLAKTINEKLFNKKTDKIEMFDIAQAGVKGINKLMGSKMTLERTYDVKGNPEKTEFTSRLIAISTPVKK